jgi:hypothetical protein
MGFILMAEIDTPNYRAAFLLILIKMLWKFYEEEVKRIQKLN